MVMIICMTKKKKKEEEKKAKENELNGPERMYQKYLSEIEKWNKRCNDILGDDQTEDTINYYKKIQHYINNNLEQELKNAQEMRNNLVQELVDLKKITLSTYNKLYAPVLDFVERFKDKMRDYPIQFSASFIVRDFSSRFFDIVSQSSIIRKSKFPQNPKRSVRFSGKRTKRSVQKRKARNTQKAETKVL